ncbi:MAG: CHASE2 domain-containing protein, partial [Comamonadaceae bacterium]
MRSGRTTSPWFAAMPAPAAPPPSATPPSCSTATKAPSTSRASRPSRARPPSRSTRASPSSPTRAARCRRRRCRAARWASTSALASSTPRSTSCPPPPARRPSRCRARSTAKACSSPRRTARRRPARSRSTARASATSSTRRPRAACCRASRNGRRSSAAVSFIDIARSSSIPGMLKSPHPVSRRLRLIAWGAALLLWLFCVLVFGSAVKMADERGTDLIWRLTAQTEAERRVIVVDIDDASLARLGPWPWPRPLVAQLVRQLDSYGVGLKVFDVVFPEDREGTPELAAALAAKDKMADAQAPNVLAQVFAIRNESTLRVGQPVGSMPEAGCSVPAPVATGVIANVANLHHRAGHISPTIDADGAVRRIPAVICFGGRSYPTLALAALSSLGPAETGSPSIAFARSRTLWEAPWSVSFSALPGRSFAMDEAGQLRVPFKLERGAFTSVSAVDVIERRVSPGLLQGAWVVVGASAFGLSDTVPTALGGAVSGSDVHAQLLTALVDGTVPLTPNGAVLL